MPQCHWSLDSARRLTLGVSLYAVALFSSRAALASTTIPQQRSFLPKLGCTQLRKFCHHLLALSAVFRAEHFMASPGLRVGVQLLLQALCSFHTKLALQELEEPQTRCFASAPHGCGSKPCTPGEHLHRWYMGVHLPQYGGIRYDPWPH